jgi:hypothetical protein
MGLWLLMTKWERCRSNTWPTEGRLRLKCDGTRAETRLRLSAKRTSPFKSAGASVQSTTGSRCVRISGSNAGYTMFRGSVKSTGYTLHSPVSPFTSPPVRHHVPSHFNWTLLSKRANPRKTSRLPPSCREQTRDITDMRQQYKQTTWPSYLERNHNSDFSV